jgi:hypothetical protein
LDGTRDLPRIIEHVSQAHPGQPVARLWRGAEQLLGTGYVEDVAAPVPTGISGRDIRRHYLARRVVQRGAGPDPDPSRDYPPPQRRAVRVYSAVLLAGTAICLGVEFAVSLPALIALLVRAVAEIGATALGTLDGAVMLALLVTVPVLWCVRWWDRHREQVRSLARNHLKGGAATWR